MAAPLGFKDFTTGEVLTAADVDGYLMQGIWVFANTTARDAAVTSPQEGNFAFTKDTNSLWYYDGAAWVASGATGDIEGVTAGVGISGGGTSGTVTVTNSMATAIDAKGDLVVGTGADTFSKLTVGANDTVLTADSSTSTGLKWASASGGAPFLFQKVTGNYYGMQTVAPAQAVASEDVTYYIPVYLAAGTYDRLAIRSGSSLSGTQVVRLGIYNVDATTGLPSTVVLDAGTVNCAFTSSTFQITISQTLTAGYYYLAFNRQSGDIGGAYFIFLTNLGANTGPSQQPAIFSGDNTIETASSYHIIKSASVTGAFATFTTVDGQTGNAPIVMIRSA